MEMPRWKRKTPFQKEWEALCKREQAFLERRKLKKESALNQLLAEKVSERYLPEEQIARTSGMLSKELLYMKFLQGIPVVGVVGGAYDIVYMKQICEYTKIKYQKRFLLGHKRQ